MCPERQRAAEALAKKVHVWRERVDTGPYVGAGDVLWSAVLLLDVSLPSSSCDHGQEAERKLFPDAAASAEAERKRAETVAQVCMRLCV